jgi:hypothetical protein
MVGGPVYGSLTAFASVTSTPPTAFTSRRTPSKPTTAYASISTPMPSPTIRFISRPAFARPIREMRDW